MNKPLAVSPTQAWRKTGQSQQHDEQAVAHSRYEHRVLELLKATQQETVQPDLEESTIPENSKSVARAESMALESKGTQMDVLDECISDLNSQLQEWLGFDIPAEGTEDYDIWQMKISLIEQVKSISDVYSLCESGDFNLPSVLEEDRGE